MKKLFGMALLLMLCMVLLAVPMSAETVGGKSGAVDWMYDTDTHALTISGTGAMHTLYFDEDDVPWHAYRDQIETITIAEGVTDIAGYVFADCTKVTQITIPSTVTKIGRYAFKGCTGLVSMTIPDTVEEMGTHVLYKCSGLTEVKLSNKLTEIPDHTFEHCTNLSKVDIPESVTAVREYAFSYCPALQAMDLPDAVTVIESYAFHSSGLKSIVIPNGVTNLASYTFRSCASLTDVIIPESVMNIGYYAFLNCTSLQQIVIPKSVTQVQNGSFDGCSNLSVVIYEGEQDAREAGLYGNFRDCPLVTEVMVPNDYQGNTFCGKPVVKCFTVTWMVDETVFSSGLQKSGSVTVPPAEQPQKAQSSCTSYGFTGWSAQKNGTVLTEFPVVAEDAAYYAVFAETVEHMGVTYQYLQDGKHSKDCTDCDEAAVTENCVYDTTTNRCKFCNEPKKEEQKYYPDYEDNSAGETAEEEWKDYIVLCRKLNVRSGAGTQYAKVGSLRRNEIVKGKMQDNGWVLIQYGDTEAYVSAQYVALYEGAAAQRTVTVLCRSLNVRVGAGTDCEKVGSAVRGEVLTVVDEYNGWYKVEFDGGCAWVCGKYAA